MEKLIELEDMIIPQDNYKVSIRYNEANIEEYGVVRLKGQKYNVTFEFTADPYIQAVDLRETKGTYEVMTTYPKGCYLVENSSLLMELHSQGHLQTNIEDSFRRFRHYRILLDQLMIDVVDSDFSLYAVDFHLERVD